MVDIIDLLQDAINNARESGHFHKWLQTILPSSMHHFLANPILFNNINAQDILGSTDTNSIRENFNIIFPLVPSIHWMRDIAIFTPKGLILSNFQPCLSHRYHESTLANFIFSNSSLGIPIVFDARNEKVHLQGGDVIVLNNTTLIVGVGHMTDIGAAPCLARKLGMDVIAVNLAPKYPKNSLGNTFLHLDSIINIINHKIVLVAPFFLEKDNCNCNPVINILRQMVSHINFSHCKQEEPLKPKDCKCLRREIKTIINTIKLIPSIGWITKYHACTGKEELLDMKLLDYLREEGYKIIYVGGDQGDLSLEKWIVNRVLYELTWQGTNVLQLSPGKVLAFKHNRYTNAALEENGIEVITFDGSHLVVGRGGPHCLTMPLIRKFHC